MPPHSTERDHDRHQGQDGSARAGGREVRHLPRGLHPQRADHPRVDHVPAVRLGGGQRRPAPDAAHRAAGQLGDPGHGAQRLGHRHQHAGRRRRRVLHGRPQPRPRVRRRHRHPALSLPHAEHHLLQLRPGRVDRHPDPGRVVGRARPRRADPRRGHRDRHHGGGGQERRAGAAAAGADHGRGRAVAGGARHRGVQRRVAGAGARGHLPHGARRVSGSSSRSSSPRSPALPPASA